ncbi:MAG: hypothetical protein DMF93_09470 [Acidobacteria bacterium]|nr:MAG: hypothetical protein DMF93_09470 [Acidobacteriota bacterium]
MGIGDWGLGFGIRDSGFGIRASRKRRTAALRSEILKRARRQQAHDRNRRSSHAVDPSRRRSLFIHRHDGVFPIAVLSVPGCHPRSARNLYGSLALPLVVFRHELSSVHAKRAANQARELFRLRASS